MLRLPGGWEWLLLLAIVVIVFGVGRLPEVGGAIGRSLREFREALKGDAKAEKPAESAAEESTDDGAE